MAKPVKYDRHARRRMKWRKISQEEVEQVIAEPDRSEQSKEERINAFKFINGRLIKVSYREFGDELLVITAVAKFKGRGADED